MQAPGLLLNSHTWIMGLAPAGVRVQPTAVGSCAQMWLQRKAQNCLGQSQKYSLKACGRQGQFQDAM